jgi:hypothetical protein
MSINRISFEKVTVTKPKPIDNSYFVHQNLLRNEQQILDETKKYANNL